MASEPGSFLTAEWRDLVLVSYEAPAALLEPLVPRGTELDRHRGSVFVSLVGFRFLDTRVLGCRLPGHVDFDEVNLRFYVRREVDGEVRRAVTFVKEVVPRRLIAAMARAGYNEPYVALPMTSEIATRDADGSTRARYAWRSAAGDHHLEVLARGELRLPAAESDEAFITEHYWGYTRQRDGGTLEYRVAHPTWRLRTAATAAVEGDMGAFYGPAFAEILAADRSPRTSPKARASPSRARRASPRAASVSRPRPQDRKTPGPQDPRTPGPQDLRTSGPQDLRTSGLQTPSRSLRASHVPLRREPVGPRVLPVVRRARVRVRDRAELRVVLEQRGRQVE